MVRNTKEDYKFIQESYNLREENKRNAIKNAREARMNFLNEHDQMIERREAKANALYEFRNVVKESLVRRFLNGIIIESMNAPSIEEQSLCEVLVGNYVRENGADEIMKRCRLSRDFYLNEVASCYKKYYKSIVEDATTDSQPISSDKEISDELDTTKNDDLESKESTEDKINNDNPLVMNTPKVEEFWKEIDANPETNDITNTIRLRVANAEEEFINRVQQDKENINDILKDTAERVKTAQETGKDDYASAVETSESAVARDKIYHIQHEMSRNVFNQMVTAMSESVMKHEDLKNGFLNESGRLDVGKVVDSVRCIYTLMEAVSYLKIENVDEEYIKNTLASMKQ